MIWEKVIEKGVKPGEMGSIKVKKSELVGKERNQTTG